MSHFTQWILAPVVAWIIYWIATQLGEDYGDDR